METVFFVGNLLTLALLGAIVASAYRTLWQALVVVTPVGEQVIELFLDDDPSQQFWLEFPDESGSSDRRVGNGLTIGSAKECDLRIEDSSVGGRHLQVLPYRDWCAVELLEAEASYRIEGEEIRGHSLLKEGQCLSIGELSLRLVRRTL